MEKYAYELVGKVGDEMRCEGPKGRKVEKRFCTCSYNFTLFVCSWSKLSS